MSMFPKGYVPPPFRLGREQFLKKVRAAAAPYTQQQQQQQQQQQPPPPPPPPRVRFSHRPTIDCGSHGLVNPTKSGQCPNCVNKKGFYDQAKITWVKASNTMLEDDPTISGERRAVIICADPVLNSAGASVSAIRNAITGYTRKKSQPNSE
jgi:hypothetical protein